MSNWKNANSINFDRVSNFILGTWSIWPIQLHNFLFYFYIWLIFSIYDFSSVHLIFFMLHNDIFNSYFTFNFLIYLISFKFFILFYFNIKLDQLIKMNRIIVGLDWFSLETQA